MDADIIDVFLAIERGCICHVGAVVVRNDCDVIPDLRLVRITDEWIEWVANRDIWRPGVSAINAERIKELRSDVVRRVTRIVPDDIDSTARRNRERAEPMPFGVINRIVIDSTRRAERNASIAAADKHYVAAITKAGWLNTRQHIDVVVSARTRAVNGEKNLSH